MKRVFNNTNFSQLCDNIFLGVSGKTLFKYHVFSNEQNSLVHLYQKNH